MTDKEFEPRDFFREFMEMRHEPPIPEPEELKKLKEEQHNMHKKYPDAEEFSYDNKDIEQGRCPYCHKDMEFDITGDLWDLHLLNEKYSFISKNIQK